MNIVVYFHMIQDLRKRIFIVSGIAVLLLLIGILLWFVFRRPSQPEATDATTTTVAPSAVLPPPPARTTEAPLEAQEPEDVYLKQLSGMFVERFGSFSNQNENQHIDDVLPLVTQRMRVFVESQVETFHREYSGVTTRVVATKIENKTASAATVRIDVQRVTTAKNLTETAYASGRVLLAREGENWKIDGLFWDDNAN